MRNRQLKHDQAARLFLSGEMTSTKQIAAALKLDVITVARWRKQASWDELKASIPKRAEALLESHIAATCKKRNTRDRLFWGLILAEAGILLARPEVSADELKTLQGIVASCQQALTSLREDKPKAS